MDRYDHFNHHDGHPLAWVLFVLLLLAVAALIVIAARSLLAPRGGASPVSAPPAPRADDALMTVRMRYARGEIGRDDFLRISEDLGGPPATTADIPPPG
jgi:uncharacterized membrane protein